MEKPGVEVSDDMLQWMLNERVKKQFGDKDYQTMAQFQLQVAFAAIHTTSMALTNMIFDLIAWPEYIEILRAEVKEQLAANGNSYRGAFVKNLPKLDSFMKESQRHNPVGYSKPSHPLLPLSQNLPLTTPTQQ
jgi:cytochrome P450